MELTAAPGAENVENQVLVEGDWNENGVKPQLLRNRRKHWAVVRRLFRSLIQNSETPSFLSLFQC